MNPVSPRCSVSCNVQPVDGAGQETISWPSWFLIRSFFDASDPDTNTGIEVTSGWPTM